MNKKLFELIDLTIQIYDITPYVYQSYHDPLFSGSINICPGSNDKCFDIIVKDYIRIILFPTDNIRIYGDKFKSRTVPVSEMVQLCHDIKTMDDTQLLLTWGKLDLLTNKIPINSIDYFYCKKFLVDALKESGDKECM